MYSTGFMSISTVYCLALLYCTLGETSAPCVTVIRPPFLSGPQHPLIMPAVVLNVLSCVWWILGTQIKGVAPANSWPSYAGGEVINHHGVLCLTGTNRLHVCVSLDAGLGDIYSIPNWRQYVASMYFSFTTLTTVGYGGESLPSSTHDRQSRAPKPPHDRIQISHLTTPWSKSAL